MVWLKRLFGIVVFLPVIAGIIALAVTNRHSVKLALDPLSANAGYEIEAPFFLFLFAAIACGVLIGGSVMWLKQGRWRKLAREKRREVERLQQEVMSLKEASAQPQAPVDINLPHLPPFAG